VPLFSFFPTGFWSFSSPRRHLRTNGRRSDCSALCSVPFPSREMMICMRILPGRDSCISSARGMLGRVCDDETRCFLVGFLGFCSLFPRTRFLVSLSWSGRGYINMASGIESLVHSPSSSWMAQCVARWTTCSAVCLISWAGGVLGANVARTCARKRHPPFLSSWGSLFRLLSSTEVPWLGW